MKPGGVWNAQNAMSTPWVTDQTMGARSLEAVGLLARRVT